MASIGNSNSSSRASTPSEYGIDLSAGFKCRKCTIRNAVFEFVFTCRHKLCTLCVLGMIDTTTGIAQCLICEQGGGEQAPTDATPTGVAHSPRDADTPYESLPNVIADSLSPMDTTTPLISSQSSTHDQTDVDSFYSGRSILKTILGERDDQVKGNMFFIAIHPQEHLIFISDRRNHQIHVIDAQGTRLQSFGKQGSGDGQFESPRGVTVSHATIETEIFVADTNNFRIQVLKFVDMGLVYDREFGSEGNDENQFLNITDVTEYAGKLYAADHLRIKIFTTNGHHIHSITRSFTDESFGCVAVNSSGIYATSFPKGSVHHFSHEGRHVRSIKPENFDPFGLCFDTSGRLVVANHDDSSLYIIDPSSGDVLFKLETSLRPNNLKAKPVSVECLENGKLIVSDHCLRAKGQVSLY